MPSPSLRPLLAPTGRPPPEAPSSAGGPAGRSRRSTTSTSPRLSGTRSQRCLPSVDGSARPTRSYAEAPDARAGPCLGRQSRGRRSPPRAREERTSGGDDRLVRRCGGASRPARSVITPTTPPSRTRRSRVAGVDRPSRDRDPLGRCATRHPRVPQHAGHVQVQLAHPPRFGLADQEYPRGCGTPQQGGRRCAVRGRGGAARPATELTKRSPGRGRQGTVRCQGGSQPSLNGHLPHAWASGCGGPAGG